MSKAGISLLLIAGLAARAQAADWLDLPVVKPVISCEQLVGAVLGQGELAGATVRSATVLQSPQGPFCKVMGDIGPAIVTFQVFLPIERWTQRFAQSAQNTLPIARSGTNQPALNGELVLAITDKGGAGISRETPWTYDNQQKRIDWAYRANHVTSLAAKALIKAFYGRPQRYSYFIGCSMGGRETLSDTQRYPDDFNGVVAGAPVVIDSVHNTFFPGWEWEANRRTDGSIILASNRLDILHDAVIKQCARKSGLLDGMLQHPSACQFDAAWVQCPAGAANVSKCLTAEEIRVARKLYDGPMDRAGRQLDGGGFPLGSELFWKLSTAAGPANEATAPGRALMRILSPSDPGETPATMEQNFGFNQVWFDKVVKTAPLWNTANTNLRPFQKNGGKLILWIGGSDLTVQPTTTIAYYQGVQKELGARPTNGFARFFLLPGVGHCGGGEGPAQFDVLSPLMAWTELNRAPEMLVVGKTAGGGGGGGGQANPFSQPAAPTLFTRPVYPYPDVAQYTGNGDPKDAANYRTVKPALEASPHLPPEILQFFGPDNQKFYRVENGRLAESWNGRNSR
jgi:feruloyl esterase